MSQVRQIKAIPIGVRKRWPLLLGGALCIVLVGYIGLWILSPGPESYDPKVLAMIQPGMTRHEVEKTLGRPLAPQMGPQGIKLLSNRPDRSSTPGLMEEGGLDLYFDDQDVLRDMKRWGFARPESFSERMGRRLGL